MSITDVAFIQKVNVDGFHWQDTAHPRTGKLIPALHEGPPLRMLDPEASLTEHLRALDEAFADSDPSNHKQYSTADMPDLFRRFANTQTTKEAILEFVNKYGSIGVGESIVIDEDTKQDGSLWRTYEKVEFGHIWAREIAAMRSAIEILDLMDEALGTNIEELWKRFRYKNESWYVLYEYLPGYTQQGKVDWVNLGIWADESEAFESLDCDDITGVAIEFIRAVANEKLAGRVNATIAWDYEHSKTMLIYKPVSLLGAMWVQFAATLTRTNNSRACIECGKLFDFIRRNRVFCSEACQKRYGRRKAKQTDLQ